MQKLIVDLSGTVGREYVPLAEDVARTLVIQVMVQMLVVAASDGATPFFSADFFLCLLYVVLGVCAYHLLLKRAVVFV